MLSSISESFFSIWLTLASSNSRQRNSDSYKTKEQEQQLRKMTVFQVYDRGGMVSSGFLMICVPRAVRAGQPVAAKEDIGRLSCACLSFQCGHQFGSLLSCRLSQNLQKFNYI